MGGSWNLGCGLLGSWLVLTPPPLTCNPGEGQDPRFYFCPLFKMHWQQTSAG